MEALIIKVFEVKWIYTLIISFFNGQPINCLKFFWGIIDILSNCKVNKCLVDSKSRQHVQNGLTPFSKLCLNLSTFAMSVKVAQAYLNLMSNFRPKEWWILYIKISVGRPSLKVLLNFLKDFALRICKFSLFHSWMV